MSGPEDFAENFLQRWSRRKQSARTSESETEKPRKAGAGREPSPVAAAPEEAALPVFDPASLPPIESITAVSDISVFLAPGVPAEITRAALRRAWATDPTIRDFVGLAENQWDFTRPDGVPGFGSLELTPELRRMVARIVGNAAAEAETLSAPAQIDQAQIDPVDERGDAIPAAAPWAGEGAVGIAPTAPSEPHKSDETAAVPRPVMLSGEATDPALPGQTEGLPTMSRRRHGRAVPKT